MTGGCGYDELQNGNEMTDTFGTGNRNCAGRIAVRAVAWVAWAVLLAGCSHKELVCLYTVDIEDYSYSGGSLPGPMGYLSGLDVADRFTVSACKESDADARARTRFDTEMTKIDPAALDVSAAGGSYRFRYVLRSFGSDGKVLAERWYGGRF